MRYRRLKKMTSIGEITEQLVKQNRLPGLKKQSLIQPKVMFGAMVGTYVDGMHREGDILVLHVKDRLWQKQLMSQRSELLQKARIFDPKIVGIKIEN
ncbi:hypothetical protein [Acanthopleuribacter pedis]|uniref:DUF721 domain-containing protein n=1 Tax=Acanthopleuribacter pedis TaxID=442870 RepID=A0A8J7U514_9BACT|nr:hypothetical protein [Acanthopleuribacter pedis]MBO1321227.1 hypothetical protein [Acanthopleuribacter pedis]